MTGFLDIYVKLIIATISFVAPLIVFMLSVFTEGSTIVYRKGKEYESQIDAIVRNQATDGTLDRKLIEESGRLYKANERKYKKDLNLLNPVRQLTRIFCPLLFALFFIMADMIVKDTSFKIYNHWLSIVLICFSFISFGIGVSFLRQVASAIIDTKQMIEREKSAIPVGAVPVTIAH